MTDALKYIVNNTAEQESRTVIDISFRELMHPVSQKEKQQAEQRAEQQASDIVANMKNKLNELGGG